MFLYNIHVSLSCIGVEVFLWIKLLLFGIGWDCGLLLNSFQLLITLANGYRTFIWNYCPSDFAASLYTSRDLSDVKMSSDNEVTWGFEGKLSEANANEKYLYNRVMELEKRNQKLEKKVKKLKKNKKGLKEEVTKLRGATSAQHIADDHDASTSDVEVIEEPNLSSGQSNLDGEQAVNRDINSSYVDE